jgi:phosphorylcholine metabolism protein LicD
MYRFNKSFEAMTVIKYPKDLIDSQLYELMEILDTKFTQAGIQYMVTCGTLLGVVREGKIIPHDDDIDIDVYQDQIDKVVSVLSEICAENPKYHYYPFSLFGYKFVNMESHQIDQDNGAQIDIFIRNRDNENIVYYQHKNASILWPKEAVVKKSFVFPLKRAKFGKISVSIPSNPDAILRQFYGNNYMIPVVYNHNRAI